MYKRLNSVTTMETERLVIRRFRAEDREDLYDYLSRPEAVRFEPYDVYGRDAAAEEAARRSQSTAFWAVCLKATGKLIGNVYFERYGSEEFMTWEIGYVFNPDYWGKGYATEACVRVMDHAFRNLRARRIVAMCNPLNTASWKLMERLNMRREGLLLKNVYFKRDGAGEPVWCDTYLYAILADEWAR